MLNPDLKLNTKIFNEDVEKKATRQGFGEGLLQAGIKNKNVVALCADLSESTKMKLFAERFPERFIEVGVAEQNLVSVASGMAAMGKIPFASSFAIFSPGRNWEQIRTNICYNDRPVKIASTHAGVEVGPDGGSHQMTEDIALMRVLPNMVIISPVDAIEAKKATIICSENKKPTYIRLTRGNSPLITTDDTPFEIGKAQTLFVPDKLIADIGIISTGPITYEALIAARELEKRGVKVKLINLSTIKPLDEQAVINLAKETRAIITVEDHQVAGGMGSAIAECLSKNNPTFIKFIGIRDSFGQSGTKEELYEEYNLNHNHIMKAVDELLLKKSTL